MALAHQQLTALNRLIRAIAPSNRFYQPKLATAGGLDGFAALDDFRARMPFTTKDELARDQVAHPPYGSTLTYPRETYSRYHQTSGTSGRPLLWLDDRDSWQWVVDRWKVVWEKAGAGRGDSVLFTFSFGPFLGFWAAFDSAVQLGLLAIPAGGMSSLDRLRFLLARRPRILCCTPTYALRLADVAREAAISLRDSGVELIMLGGEPGGSVPEFRARLAQGWPGARVVDHHGMTEIGPASYGLPDQPTFLQLLHDAYLCEVLQPGTNRPVAPGEQGELVLTTLGRTACPLLRYRTGDLVRPAAVAGEDPAAFALAGGILGRVDDMVIVRGVNLYPTAVEAVVHAVSGIRDYAAEIDRRGALAEVTVRFEPTEPHLDPSAELATRLRDAFQIRFNVEKVPAGVLPVFEMKARRWKILS